MTAIVVLAVAMFLFDNLWENRHYMFDEFPWHTSVWQHMGSHSPSQRSGEVTLQSD